MITETLALLSDIINKISILRIMIKNNQLNEWVMDRLLI